MFAQLVNDGATITVKAGATLFVETNVSNNTAGVINVEAGATLDVQGNLTNAPTATLTTIGTGKVKFSGTGPSTLTSGGDAIENLEIAKTTGTGVVTLGDAAKVNNTLTLTSNKLNLASFDLTMGTAAAQPVGSATSYVQADGAGKMVKERSAVGSFTFPVGDVDDYSPITSNVTAATFPASVGVRVVDAAVSPLLAGTTDYITRNWPITQTGPVTANTLTGTYVAADLVGTAAKAKGSSYNGTDWSFVDAATAGSTVTGSIAAAPTTFTGTNFFGKVNMKTYLAGAYVAATNDMTTALNAPTGTNWLETSALTSPYNAAPFNAAPASVSAGFFLANPTIVDWIMIELRDPAAPGTATTNRASAFLKKDGSIVGIDGTSMPTIKDGLPTSVVAIHHRNHLMMRTVNAGTNVITPTPIDFRTDLSQIYVNTTLANTPVRTLEAAPNGPGGLAAYGMWAGDATSSGVVGYNGSANDRLKVLAKVGGATPNNVVPGYFVEDCNLNGSAAYNGSANDRLVILNTVGGATPNNLISSHN
jgi:hypothetical protein